MTNMIHCQLWMGSLEPFMNESFVMSAFHKMGEFPQNVKIMRNKFSSESAGYCFVHFSTDEAAIDAMHKLNGKPIPDTDPVIRFRLNNASSQVFRVTEYSIWVGDLSSDVDDYSLYRAFGAKYSSIKTAKVILDNMGFSKGYGFVRFGLEEEQKNALYAMNGYMGLGTKPLKICNAVPKPKGSYTSTTNDSQQSYGGAPQTNSQDYSSQYYDPSTYWQNSAAAWQAQGSYYEPSQAPPPMDMSQAPPMIETQQPPVSVPNVVYDNTEQEIKEYELALIDHKVVLDVNKMNREVMDQDRNLWDALESTKWCPMELIEGY